MLFVFLLITIMIVAVVVNVILMYRGRADMTRRVTSLEAAVKKLNAGTSGISLLDHAEFAKLDPEVKDLYRKYVVNNLMPRAMEELNKEIAEKKYKDAMRMYGEYAIAMDNDTLFAGMRA